MLHLGSLKKFKKSIVLEFFSLYRFYDHFEILRILFIHYKFVKNYCTLLEYAVFKIAGLSFDIEENFFGPFVFC